jgi:hypothetical protein
VVAVVGVVYLGVIGSWLALVRTPDAPIGDPYLLLMEVLTILSALGLSGWVAARLLLAAPHQRLFAVSAFAAGVCASALTITVHLVQLTAVRQMWKAGVLPDYRLVWPSPLFAVEYVAWDLFTGLTMIFLGLDQRTAGETGGRLPLLVGGGLCLVGFGGPLSGNLSLQNLAVLGYGVLLPLGAYLSIAGFRSEPTSPPPPLQ